MAGNVWEWAWDEMDGAQVLCTEAYEKDWEGCFLTDRKPGAFQFSWWSDSDMTEAIIRGGSFDNDLRSLRPANRGFSNKRRTSGDTGLRLVRSLGVESLHTKFQNVKIGQAPAKSGWDNDGPGRGIPESFINFSQEGILRCFYRKVSANPEWNGIYKVQAIIGKRGNTAEKIYQYFPRDRRPEVFDSIPVFELPPECIWEGIREITCPGYTHEDGCLGGEVQFEIHFSRETKLFPEAESYGEFKTKSQRQYRGENYGPDKEVGIDHGFGLRLDVVDAKAIVKVVDGGSDAARQGVEAGWELVRIGDKSVPSMLKSFKKEHSLPDGSVALPHSIRRIMKGLAVLLRRPDTEPLSLVFLDQGGRERIFALSPKPIQSSEATRHEMIYVKPKGDTEPFWMGATEVTQALVDQVQESLHQNSIVFFSNFGEPFGDAEEVRWHRLDEEDEWVGRWRLYEQSPEERWKTKGGWKPEYPITNLNWYRALRFCNRLSKMEGLQPAYVYTSNGVALLRPEANGYRLPTRAQWDAAVEAKSRFKKTKGSPICIEEPPDFKLMSEINAWREQREKRQAEAVTESEKTSAGFYGLTGNVQEWLWDRYEHDGDPSIGSWERAVIGGNVQTYGEKCSPTHVEALNPSKKSPLIGFRVVRPAGTQSKSKP